MHPNLMYRAGKRLSPAELTSMRLDGLLFEVGDAFLPAGVPETLAVRLASLAPYVREEHVVSGVTAAWAHGAGDLRPNRCHVRPHVSRRLRAPSDGSVVLHDGVVPAEEIQTAAGVRVLTVAATLVDLARSARTDGARRHLLALMGTAPDQADAAVEQLRARRRLPGKRQAIAVLESCYEEVTRYTS